MPFRKEHVKGYSDSQIKQLFSDEILDKLVHDLGYRKQSDIIDDMILNKLKNKNIDKHVGK